MSTELSPESFEAIESAVLETQRGRWFLAEYAKRLRSRETTQLLDQMRRLEATVLGNHDELIARLGEALARSPKPDTAVPPVPELAPRHMKYFKKDEDIFEPAPQAAIAAVKPSALPDEKRGARLTITRIGAASEAADAEAVQEQPSRPEVVAEEPPQAAAPPSRRIVIVRHKPGEEISVPVQEDLARAG
ncbi:MAG: hypothetical protein NTU78_01510 [Alphaproteobacteria bacterium]|jgi:hypothetical protein|nr:hypothetical protein [Alphaproteobacteria bacterium]